MIGDNLINPEYAFVSAFLKGDEQKLVTSEHMNRLSVATNIRDALRIINDTYIGSYLEEANVKTFSDIDGHLWGYFHDCLNDIDLVKSLPDEIRQILDLYLVKYDVANIKATLVSILTGKKARLVPMGIINNHGFLDRLSNAEEVGSVIDLLITCKLGDYAAILKEYEIDESKRSRLLVEARLEGEYHKNLLNITKSVSDGSDLLKAWGLILDLTNLQIISRAIIDGIGSEASECLLAEGYIISIKTGRELLQIKLDDVSRRLANTNYQGIADEIAESYNKSKSITAVDEVIDKHKYKLTRELLSPWALSPLAVVWYLITKETEMRNLRLIMKALEDSVPLGEIKNYLVSM